MLLYDRRTLSVNLLSDVEFVSFLQYLLAAIGIPFLLENTNMFS